MLSRRAIPHLSRTLRRAASTSSSQGGNVSNKKPTDVVAPAQLKEGLPAVQQAPNYPTTWSTSQRPRPGLGSSPRFEQTNMDLQPQPLSAMELVANEPVRLVHGRKAVCDGGGGPLGHPKIYINLDQPGPRACGYCGIRFEQAPHHH